MQSSSAQYKSAHDKSQHKSSLAGPTYVLMAVATSMLQIALYDRQGFVSHEWVQLGVVLGVGLIIQRIDKWSNPKAGNAIATLSFMVIAGMPFLTDAFSRTYSLFGIPFEIQMVLCLRNLMICLGLGNRDSRSLLFASLASGFLTLFSFLWLMNRWTIALVFVYAVVGMWWLMGIYWDRLSGCFVSRSERRIPWKPVLGAALLGVIVLLASLPFATGSNYTTAIRGLLPSSGGTGRQDEFAFGGVGDGPQMVSAKENASGFGPIESELFLESKMPSLYDAINEFSDAVPKPKKKGRQRAIPLAPSQMQENHQRRGITQRAGREFSAIRRQKQETPKVKDLRSRALLQVVGRVPVHLGMYAYDTWDGRSLTSSDSAHGGQLTLDRDAFNNKSWAKLVGVNADECLSYQDQHELRILNLKTDRIPAPPNVSGVNIDKIHTEKFFRMSPDGMLALDMDRIPQLTVMHVQSLQRRGTHPPRLALTESHTPLFSDSLTTIAQGWTNGVEQGWPQVEAICTRLRMEYALDPKAMVPEHVEDAASHFLTESKCGPDYLFATSAVLLLRTLGYETRVVSGFYADPKNYDRQSRITSVYAKDAHFWVEILASSKNLDDMDSSQRTSNYWIAVEPSPGYEVLLAPESFWSHLLTRAALTWHAIKGNPIQTFAIGSMLILAWFAKAHLLDLLVTIWWLVVHRWGDLRYRVTSTVRLLERRAAAHGCPRAPGVPLGKWCQTVAPTPNHAEIWQEPFVDVANWAFYGGLTNSGYSNEEVVILCKQAAASGMLPSNNWRTSIALLVGKASQGEKT